MKKLMLLFTFLFIAGCGLENVAALSTQPVTRFQIAQYREGDSGSQILCGVDTTGLGAVNFYEGLAADVLVIGHQTTGADDRCRKDRLTRLNGYVGFDLSGLSVPRPGSTGAPRITGALLTAKMASAPDFDGGATGCRRGRTDVGMLDYVFWLPGNQFFPATEPDLSNPPKSVEIRILRIDGREVTFNTSLIAENPPLEVTASSRNAITLSLDDRALAALQVMVNENSAGLRRVGLYFAGTNGGSTTTNQTCLDYFEDIRLTVFYRDDA